MKALALLPERIGGFAAKEEWAEETLQPIMEMENETLAQEKNWLKKISGRSLSCVGDTTCFLHSTRRYMGIWVFSLDFSLSPTHPDQHSSFCVLLRLMTPM